MKIRAAGNEYSHVDERTEPPFASHNCGKAPEVGMAQSIFFVSMTRGNPT